MYRLTAKSVLLLVGLLAVSANAHSGAGAGPKNGGLATQSQLPQGVGSTWVGGEVMEIFLWVLGAVAAVCGVGAFVDNYWYKPKRIHNPDPDLDYGSTDTGAKKKEKKKTDKKKNKDSKSLDDSAHAHSSSVAHPSAEPVSITVPPAAHGDASPKSPDASLSLTRPLLSP